MSLKEKEKKGPKHTTINYGIIMEFHLFKKDAWSDSTLIMESGREYAAFEDIYLPLCFLETQMLFQGFS